MIGTCDAMRRIFSMIRRVAATDVPVLISGQSGTGKELAALSIHERSARAAGPFVPINCSAIPEGLLESELFGHERGAFTGAMIARPGRLEIADGGTVFLDEIGELAPLLQAKLLRFLQDHLLERVGGRKSRRLDVRVVAATNCDLTRAVAEGRFREDLFYRLAVFTIELPPLRDRGEDIPVLARFFLERYAEQAGKQIHGFSRGAADELSRARWPGNVREMINRVRRSVVVADGPLVTPGDLGFGSDSIEEPLLTLKEARVRAETESLRRALQRTNGNRTEAARLLGISRTQFYDLVGRHRIRDEERR
jgi:two-component system NtrC family response regulator